MAQTITPQNNAGVAIGNATIPVEGPKTIPLQLDFTIDSRYSIDPLLLYMQQTLSLIQGVWADNSKNGSPLTVSISATKQNIVIAPGDQGFYPVLSPKSGTIEFFTNGGIVLDVSLYNVPLPASQWGTSAEGGDSRYAPGGALETQDQGLAQIIDPQKGLLVQGVTSGGGSGVADSFADFRFDQGSNNYLTLFSVNDGDVKDYYMTRLIFGVTADAYVAAGISSFLVRIQNKYGDELFGGGWLTLPTAAPIITQPQGIVKVFEYSNPNGFKIAFDVNGVALDAGRDGYGDMPQLSAGQYVSTIQGFTKAH